MLSMHSVRELGGVDDPYYMTKLFAAFYEGNNMAAKQTITASLHGFSPKNNGDENRRALQKLFDIGGHILIDKPGKYDVVGTAYIGSDTTLEFVSGASLRRVPSGDGDGRADNETKAPISVYMTKTSSSAV